MQNSLDYRATARRLLMRWPDVWLSVFLSLALMACARRDSAESAPLLVFAAANLRDALIDIARDHRAAGGDSAVLVFGSTGDLATQITNGAPADLFFAADAETIDQMAVDGSVADSSRRVYAVGRLAVIARCTLADTSGLNKRATRPTAVSIACPRLTLQDLAWDSLRTIAIADPSHAPYGRAAKQALERAGIWNVVQPKLVLGANISQAELFVRSGNADAALVALSLLQRDSARVFSMVDASLHEPLSQSVAIVSRSSRQDAARAFVTYLQSPAGRAVMERYGFTVPSASERATSNH